MLYGMEEFDDEFGLIKKETLNVKKVSLVVVIIVLFIIVFSCLTIFKTSKNSNNDTAEGTVENNQEQLINDEQQLAQEKIDIENKDKSLVKNNENEQEYNGSHMQIAEHSIEMNFLPVQNVEAHNLIKDIYFSEEKQVYLTFDDGPSKDITPQILDILKENNIKATFFVLGARVDLYPDTLKREFNEGHYIANHGYSHEYSQIYQNRDTVYDEYNRCEDSIRNALGLDYHSYLFRFPGGSRGGRYESVKAEARQLLEEYGVAYTNWNCLTGDAAGNKTKEACIQEMIETKGNQNSIILLMHDANDKQQTLDALPEIIQYYKNEGYTFKNFYEIFK